ncbi:hypothetical protein tinsulaeT_13400 [Thalassotalea insulae]|uniref:TonB-dependent receptor n=1 Tax=Thalassotalea insulae TaxID=2056778 RepID=A0ABQ6GPU1_9GAMM|nr:TonB-dependent receptor [Thalassotalea insulae]GLX78000.1 hypothetical protein tinsulaeT_13400 [Thalassotalea insulae]
MNVSLLLCQRSQRVLGLLLLCSSFTLSAREAFDVYSLSLLELSQIKISTGTPVNLNQAPAVASLITATDIQALSALTLEDVLESVPGLHVIPSTLNRTSPVYTFRGIYAGQNQQVMFMLNGYRIDGDLYASGLTHLSRMNVNNIERIEVVRGPGSAIYGADAYAGVINIITKTAAQINGTQLATRLGSHNTQNIWLQHSQIFADDWQLAVNLEYFKRDSATDRKVESDFQSSLDGLFGSSASLAPSYLDDRIEALNYNIHINNTHWQLGLDGYLKRNSGVGAGAAQSIDHLGNDHLDQYLLSLAYSNDSLIDDWSFESQLSFFYLDTLATFDIFPSGTVLPVGNDGNIFTPHDGQGCVTVNIPGIGCLTTFSEGFKGNPGSQVNIPTLELTAYYQANKDNQLRFNIGYKKEKIHGVETKNFGPGILDKKTLAGDANPVIVDGVVTSVENTPFIYVPDKTRTIKYASLQDIWQINQGWTLTTGIRYDHYSDFGSTINPRVALVWRTTNKLTSKFLYGEAFRAPSFSELYSQNNPISLGNKNLQPETINTSEVSFNYALSADLTAKLNLYHYRTDNMVAFVVNNEGVGTAQNYRSLTGKGSEIEVEWRVNDNWQVKANYAYQSTKDEANHSQVEYVPKQQFYFDARWQINSHWQLSSQLNYIINRKREEGDTREAVDDYQQVDLALRRKHLTSKPSSHWSIAAAVKNIFDKQIYEPSDGRISNDYLMHGRRVYIELSYHF